MQRIFRKLISGPYVTIMLIVIIVSIYLLMTVIGGIGNTQLLILLGAKVNFLIDAGQWWRLIFPIFIHLSIEHILINMVTLYFLGIQIENIFGHWRFLIIFLVSGIGGNLASFAFNPNALSVGSSTSIFGLLGAFLMVGESFKQYVYINQMTRTFILFIGVNIIFGFFNSGIDIAGHIGGLTTGFLMGYVVSVPKLGKIVFIKRILSGIGTIILFIGLYCYGLSI